MNAIIKYVVFFGRIRTAMSFALATAGLTFMQPSMAQRESRNLERTGETCLDIQFNAGPDKAQVVFINPYRKAGSVHASLYDGDTFISHVIGKTCFSYATEPGQHLFAVAGEAADFLSADLAAGKLYYIEVSPRMGAWKARFSMFPYTPESDDWDERNEWLSESLAVTPTPRAFVWAEEKSAEMAEKRERYYERWMEKPENSRPRLRPDDGQ